MATINHSSGADIIVPNNNGTTYRGLGGDDTYILSNSIAANAAITIVDTSGANKIQLVNGLSVASTKFAADAVQLTLSNGAVVTINGASNFDFDLGGNATSGTSGSVSDFAGFAAGAGVASLPVSGSVAGASNVSVQGTAWSGGTGGSYTVTKSASNVSEGSSVTFTITASSAVSADTSFSWTVIGDTNGSTVDKAGTADIDVLSGTATIASGASSTTFNVTASSDSIVEGIEGIKVSIFDASSNALSSSTILVNNTGSAATSQSFTLSTGVDEDTGGSGNDSFDASALASLNDFDVLDGGDGVDTLTVQNAGASVGIDTTLIPQLSNIEVINVTNSNAIDTINDNNELIIELAGIDGITTVGSIASSDGVTFNNMESVPDLTIKSPANGTVEVNMNLAALSGASDKSTITVSGTGAGLDIAYTDDGVAATAASSVLETVAIVSQSVANTINDLQLDAVSTSTIEISGDKRLTLSTATDATVVSVDASASTGGVTLAGFGFASPTVLGSAGADIITATGGGATESFSMGAGNDSIDFVNTFTGTDVYDGGDGIDTMIVGTDGFSNAGTAATVSAGISNVEVLSLTAAGTITLESDTSINTISIGTNTTDQTVNLNDGTTQAYTISIAGDTDSDDVINNNSNVQLTLNAGSADIDTDTTITGSAGTSDVLNITSTATGAAEFDAANDVFETINVVSVGTAIATTLTLGAYDTSGTGVVGATTVTIDASSLSATNTLVMGSATVVSSMNITSGAGADNITLGTGADTVSSGAGNDSIVGTQGGSNVIDTGAGVDTVTLSTSTSENISMGAGNDVITATTQLDALDTIDGGDGVDTMSVTGDLTGGSVIGGVSNVEVLSMIGAITVTATGDMGGVSTYNLTENTAAHTLVLGTATLPYSKDTTVLVTGQGATNGDSVDARASSGTLTIKGVQTDFDDQFTVFGSAGEDTIEITAAGATTADLDDVTAIENIVIKDASAAGTDAKLTVNNSATVATYGGPTSINIDATELDGGTGAFDEIFTLIGTGSMPLNVTSGGGADILDGGSANDIINGGAGADIIDGNAGLDNLSGGAGNDTIVQNSKTDFITAFGADIIDGGAGNDTLELGASMNLVASQLGTISNIENITIPDGSDLTISDALLSANPGIKFNFAGAGTLSTGEDTAGASLMTTGINIAATAPGNLKLVGSQSDDTFTFTDTENLTADDTIDGNAGSDTIILSTQDDTDTTGEEVTGTFGSNVTNVETIKISDQGADQSAGNGIVNISSGFTGLSITVDGTELDANPLGGSGESLTVANSDNTKLTVLGGGYNDTITSSTGADNISGNAGADSIKAGGGDDTIDGGAGADLLWGEAGLDSIEGGAGNDTINVADDAHFKTSGGVETVSGGAGTDTLNFAETGENLTLTAPELSKLFSVEKIALTGQAVTSLTFGNETFTNNGVSQLQITTNTGNNTTAIDASAVTNGSFLVVDDNTNANNDSITGGSGDDIFRVGDTFLATGDVFNGNGGNDTIQLDNDDGVTATINFTNVTNLESVNIYTIDGVSAGAVAITIVNDSALAATTFRALTMDFTGSGGDGTNGVTVNAADTDDVQFNFTMIGGAAADDLNGSLGNDTITGGGTTVGDVLNGNSGNDSITGNSGADAITGAAGNDILAGGAGNDTVTGGTGNDIMDGGDGADNLDGGAGVDTITTGAGKDTLLYDAVTESGGNTKDTITDFTQSTLNATTGAVITTGDSIKITVPQATFAAGAGDSFIVSDKGDVNNAGEAASAMNDSKGSFVFSKDNDVLYLDFDGDSTLNADDYAFVLTGLDSFHGADLDFDVTAQNQVLTVTTLDGDDSITGGTAADIITTNGGNDTVVGGSGVDTISTGSGNDSINGGAGADIITAGAGADIIVGASSGLDIITGGTGDDVFNAGTADAPAAANMLVIKDFEDAGTTVGDVLTIDSSSTTLVSETAGAAATMVTINVTQASGNPSILTGDADASNTADVIEILETELATTNLALDFDNSQGSGELMKLLGSANIAATGITVETAEDAFYLLAYDGGEAFLYFVDSGAIIDNIVALANEIVPIAHFDSAITLGAFDGSDFIMG